MKKIAFWMQTLQYVLGEQMQNDCDVITTSEGTIFLVCLGF